MVTPSPRTESLVAPWVQWAERIIGWGTQVRAQAPSEETESRFASHRVTNAH